MGYFEYKARKGLIKVRTSIEKGVIKELEISGDFFLYPEDALWMLREYLTNTPIDYEIILSKIKSFIEKENVQLLGSTPEDFAKAIYYSAMGARIRERLESTPLRDSS